MLSRLVYVNGTEEFVRVLYNLEAVVVVLDEYNRVVLVGKSLIRDIIKVGKDGKKK